MLSSIPPFQDEEEDLPYDVKSWFTNIIQVKVQHHGNTFETISTTFLHGLLFQMLQKILRPEKKSEALYIAPWKPDPS